MTRTLDWLAEQMLATGEESGRREFVGQLQQADDHARAIFALGSPLAVGDDGQRVIDATRVLVCGPGILSWLRKRNVQGCDGHDSQTLEVLRAPKHSTAVVYIMWPYTSRSATPSRA